MGTHVYDFCLIFLQEKETRSKFLQLLSGLKSYVYWIGSFIWDYILYLITAFILISIFQAYQLDEITKNIEFEASCPIIAISHTSN